MKNDLNDPFEKHLKARFEDFEAAPPNDAWAELASILDDKAIDAYQDAQEGHYYTKDTLASIQSKFKDYQHTPPQDGWKNILAYLNAQNPTPVSTFFWRYAVAAACFFVAMFVSIELYDKQEDKQNLSWQKGVGKLNQNIENSTLDKSIQEQANATGQESYALGNTPKTKNERLSQSSKQVEISSEPEMTLDKTEKLLSANYLQPKKSSINILLPLANTQKVNADAKTKDKIENQLQTALKTSDAALLAFLEPIAIGSLPLPKWPVTDLKKQELLATAVSVNSSEKHRNKRNWYVGAQAVGVGIGNFFKAKIVDNWTATNLATHVNVGTGLGITLETPMSQRLMLSANAEFAQVSYLVTGSAISVKPIAFNTNQKDSRTMEMTPEYGRYEFSTQYNFRVANASFLLKYVVADNPYWTHAIGAGAGVSWIVDNMNSEQAVSAGQFKLTTNPLGQETITSPTASLGYHGAYKINSRLRATFDLQSTIAMSSQEATSMTYNSRMVFNTAKIGIGYKF